MTTARCYPGEAGQPMPPAIAGDYVTLTPDGDYDAFLKEGGFGEKTAGTSLVLVCDVYPAAHWATFDSDPVSMQWSPAAVRAKIPGSIGCLSDNTNAHEIPDSTLQRATGGNTSPPWTYHIEARDYAAGGGSYEIRFSTGPLWVVGNSGWGGPPLRG